MCSAVKDFAFLGQRLVDDHVLGNDLNDGLAGIKTCVRVLEDNLQFLTHFLHLPGIVLGNIIAIIQDLSGSGLNQAQNGATQRALSAAGLADHADGLAGVYFHVDTVDCVQEGLVAYLKILFQVYGFNQRDSLFCHSLVLLFLVKEMATDGVRAIGIDLRRYLLADLHALAAARCKFAALR